eukprot:1159913-Pelagomonas_calceolata.AAC.6
MRQCRHAALDAWQTGDLEEELERARAQVGEARYTQTGVKGGRGRSWKRHVHRVEEGGAGKGTCTGVKGGRRRVRRRAGVSVLVGLRGGGGRVRRRVGISVLVGVRGGITCAASRAPGLDCAVSSHSGRSFSPEAFGIGPGSVSASLPMSALTGHF